MTRAWTGAVPLMFCIWFACRVACAVLAAPHLLGGEREAERPSPSPAPAAENDRVAALEARVTRLEEQIAELQQARE